MTAYQIQGPTRQCAQTNRELKPGEKVYSVLFEEAGRFVRKDFAADAWKGPPAGAIAFWMGRIPNGDQDRKPIFNDELLLDCFEHLVESKEPPQESFRYVLALLLMRRKRLKFEDVQVVDGVECLVLKEAKTNKRYNIPDPHLTDEQMVAVQDEIFKLLGWDV